MQDRHDQAMVNSVATAELDAPEVVFQSEPVLPKRRRLRWWLWLLAVLCLCFSAALWFEADTSWLQARLLPEYANSLSFTLGEGPSDSIRFPSQGPFDERFGYTKLPTMLQKLQAEGFSVDRQVQFSPPLQNYVDDGFYPPYPHKSHAGLTILDEDESALFSFQYPRYAFASFAEIPSLVVDSLLFIEDRRLLSSEQPQRNPTVNWGRFIKAAVFRAGEAVNLETPSMGGSTLATQMEKYYHSDQGVTGSIEEKLQQMVSASVRVYQQGQQTMPARQKLVLDYLNSVPLAAAPRYGEVNGLGDGLQIWFGADPVAVFRILASPQLVTENPEQLGLALRQVLALMIAHRRPSYYLLQNQTELSQLVDAHIRLMRDHGKISPALAEAALTQIITFRNFRLNPALLASETNKGANVVRNRLVSLLDVSLYDLDRMDLTVTTTLNNDLQTALTSHLRNLRDPAVAESLGLVGDHLLLPGQADGLRYSFTLFERNDDGNQVRVQTDNTDKPFNINEGSKLELGSTAKLRVLASYLEIIAELHHRFTTRTQAQGTQLIDGEQDPLTTWVQDEIAAQPDITLESLLAKAMERRYSAYPGEAFFTGGGRHTFRNFRREDDGRSPTVREALNESINLPFVRMLRDVISHISHQQWQNLQAVLQDDNDLRRKELLNRFADREGAQYLSRFWSKYAGKNPQERIDSFLSGLPLTPVRAAIIHRSVFPAASIDSFATFMTERAGDDVDEANITELYQQFAPGNFTLQDLGYLARVHPLELWLVEYLQNNSDVSLNDALAASTDTRQEVYQWLGRTQARSARDSRVRTMLEMQAFTELHRYWRELGFPFSSLVPSLATALGSSGDRPAALAELMGIIMNDGERRAPHRISNLVFAAATPYETQVSYPPAAAQQVMRPEIAHTLKQALADVVAKGTGKRLKGAYKQKDGSDMPIGGKTGTGDNRLVTNTGGERIVGRALSRTATLVFYLGENHFGTLTAFIVGDEAEQYRFTSALPSQVLRSMAPILEPYLQQAAEKTKLKPFYFAHDGRLATAMGCLNCVHVE